MRKRLLIGAIAAVVIGVAAYFLSQPKEGTVEYHKRKCAQARVPAWVLKKGVPGFVRNFYERRYDREFPLHRTALVDLGYLKESVFVLSNASVTKVVRAVRFSVPADIDQFTRFSVVPSNAIVVVAPSEWSDKIAVTIRKADVPENK